MFGGSEHDSLEGWNGSDFLSGGSGRDILIGGEGLETLVGGAGSDLMYGGRSPDRFVFNILTDAGGNDRILDFQVASDKIVIGQSAGAGNAPDITITVLANGLQLVTAGDVADPVFEIGVQTWGNLISESDIVFLFI